MFVNGNLMPDIRKRQCLEVAKKTAIMEDQARAFSSSFGIDPPYNDPE